MTHLSLFVAMAGAAACGEDETVNQNPDAAPREIDAALDATPPCAGRSLRTDLSWRAGVREQLQTWIDTTGCRSAAYDGASKPVALFDWDNTVIKNDIGDAITFYLIEHDKVQQPPGQDWGRTSPYMTAAAQTAPPRRSPAGTTAAWSRPTRGLPS